MSKYDYAKLRPIEVKSLVDDFGRPVLLLRDLMKLNPETPYLLTPGYWGAVLIACDGEHTVLEMCREFQKYTGLFLPDDNMEKFLERLDLACFLDNARAQAAQQQALERYRRAPNRPPANAGLSYPASADVLRRELQGYMDQIPDTEELKQGQGLISPHIDYGRGGLVYAQVWKRAAKLAREADCAIILGTDHKSAIPAQITLTRQSYATPFGVLPTDLRVVDAIAGALGEEAVFQSELHHKDEWSVELAAVWLHFIRDGEPCSMVPILCGSFHHFVNNGHSPAEDTTLADMVTAIKEATAGQKVLVVAAGDLAHIGPAFGGPPVDLAGRVRLQEDDNKLLAPVFAGDADGFFDVIRSEADSRNICGISCIYLAMQIMGAVQGELVSYDRCLADEQETSFVSVCGVTFS